MREVCSLPPTPKNLSDLEGYNPTLPLLVVVGISHYRKDASHVEKSRTVPENPTSAIYAIRSEQDCDRELALCATLHCWSVSLLFELSRCIPDLPKGRAFQQKIATPRFVR